MDYLLSQRAGLGDSSFYVYNETLIQNNIEQFKSVPYKNFGVHFASMANDNPVLLKMLQANGFGIFVNSRKHMQLALDCGFSPELIIFASTGISEPTMRLIIEKGVQINIDSRDQLKLYGKLNPGGEIGIRLNIDEKSKNNIFTGLESRIGVLESELPEIFSIADSHQLKITGTHVYLGTDVTSLDDLLEGVDRTLALSNRFADLECVDLGGGFPIDKSRFDFEQYKQIISDRMAQYSLARGRDIKLVLEPGRSMFGNCAYFFTQVSDIKERPDRILVCCDSSASLIPRAMFYEDYNPVEVYNSRSTEWYSKPVDVVGSTTYSRDFMAKGLKLPVVRVGDWLRFDFAGSYCYSMITRFLGQAMPPEYLQRLDGSFELIRAGESYFDQNASIWTSEEIAPGEAHRHKIKNILYSGESQHHKLEILETESYGIGLFLDGRIQHLEKDEYIYSESIIHPVASGLKGNNLSALVVGGGPGGAIRELLKHRRFNNVTQVEIDAGIITLTKQYLPHIAQGYHDDERVNIVVDDIASFVQETKQRYDFIIYDISEPLSDSPAENLFTETLICSLKDILTEQGALVTWAGSIGPLSSDLAKNINQLWKNVFPYTERFMSHPQSYGTSWLTVVGSNEYLGLGEMSREAVDDYCQKNIDGALKLYDGMTHQHMFALPKDVRSLLGDAYVTTKSDIISLQLTPACKETI